MANDDARTELTGWMRALGAPDPEAWAREETEEGVPHYARLVFLRSAWRRAVGPGDTGWIEAELRRSEGTEAPGGDASAALGRLLEAGADRGDLTAVVRALQGRLLADVAGLLDQPLRADYPDPELPEVEWGLFLLDEDGLPATELDGLAEDVAAADPGAA